MRRRLVSVGSIAASCRRTGRACRAGWRGGYARRTGTSRLRGPRRNGSRPASCSKAAIRSCSRVARLASACRGSGPLTIRSCARPRSARPSAARRSRQRPTIFAQVSRASSSRAGRRAAERSACCAHLGVNAVDVLVQLAPGHESAVARRAGPAPPSRAAPAPRRPDQDEFPGRQRLPACSAVAAPGRACRRRSPTARPWRPYDCPSKVGSPMPSVNPKCSFGGVTILPSRKPPSTRSAESCHGPCRPRPARRAASRRLAVGYEPFSHSVHSCSCATRRRSPSSLR